MPKFKHVVVMGASAGGVQALLEISRALPPSFAAPICIVQHVGGHVSLLPELLRFQGHNPAVHAVDGQQLQAGTLYVAPPDHHMLLEGDRLRLTRGPKENYARPAIDPLFRSAALHWGSSLIGVILSGMMDDGTAGLKAVQDCGGTTIVQDPSTAAESEMPANAMRYLEVDHCVRVEEMADLLQSLVAQPAPAAPSASRQPSTVTALAAEVAINRGENMMQNLGMLALPSTFTCPECHGSLWEVQNQRPLRYRCHIGHAYSARTLDAAQANATEEALWNTLRALREREMLVRRLASIAEATGDAAQAAAGMAQAERLKRQVEALVAMAEDSGPGSEITMGDGTHGGSVEDREQLTAEGSDDA